MHASRATHHTTRGGRQWWKLPEAVRLAIVANLLHPSDVLVAAAVARGQAWGERPNLATVRWIARQTGLSERTVRYALQGRRGAGRDRPGLAEWVERSGGRYYWRSERRFARITWLDWKALTARRRPLRDELRVWAWSLGELAGVRPFERLRWDAAAVGRVLGWEAGRARRALQGAADRIGAAAAGLVDLVDGWIHSRIPLPGSRDAHRPHERPSKLTGSCARAAGKPVERRSEGALASRVGTYWQWIRDPRSGSEIRTLLVDVLADWQRAIESAGRRPTVTEAAAYLDRLRTRDRRRGWALSVVRSALRYVSRKVSLKGGIALRASPEAGSRPDPMSTVGGLPDGT